MPREKLTDYVGLRLTKTLLARIEQYGRENFPNEKSQLGFDRTDTIQDLLQLALDRNEFNSVKQRKTISPETENDIRIKELEKSVETLKLNVTQLFTLLNNKDKEILNTVTQDFTQEGKSDVENIVSNDVTQDLTEDTQEVETGESEPELESEPDRTDVDADVAEAKDVQQKGTLGDSEPDPKPDRTEATGSDITPLPLDGYEYLKQGDLRIFIGFKGNDGTFSQAIKKGKVDLGNWKKLEDKNIQNLGGRFKPTAVIYRRPVALTD